jgi:hypothetical protein
LDFRGRFDAALTELAEHVQGVARAAPTPKQLVLAQMIETTDDELWAWLCPYSSPDDNWSRREFSDAIRNLRSDELEAAVAIGWSARAGYKMYESDLLGTIRRATGARDASARRMIRTLADDGFLEEAEADYRGRELAWYDKKILWNLRRVAQRSGLFSAIPPPFPERLSGLLAYERPGLFVGRGWRAIRFHEPLLTVLDASEPVTVVVVRCDEPARTWAFRSPDDRIPLRAARSIMETELTAVHPLAWRGHPRFIYDLPLPFDLAKFDDLGLLCA